MNNIQNLTVSAKFDHSLNRSQIDKLRNSKKNRGQSPGSHLYDQLRQSITHQQPKCGLHRNKSKSPNQKDSRLLEFKNPKELEQLVKCLLKPCKHDSENCMHDQLYSRSISGKSLRQLCEFRQDWSRQIIKLQRQYERTLIHRTVQSVECQDNEQWTSIIQKSGNQVKAIQQLQQQSGMTQESVKILNRIYRVRVDVEDSLITQFEDVQNRRRYIHAPSMWSWFDCSCNVHTI